MKSNRVSRSALLVLALAAFAPFAVAETTLSAAKETEGKAEAAVPASKGLRVAVLPLVNGTGADEADKIMEDILRDEFKLVDPARAVFIMPTEVERVLGDNDALDRAYRVTDRWSKTGVLDSTAVGTLDSILVADAVMMIQVSEWDSKRAHNIGQGQSSTTIGLHFAMYRMSDKKKIWYKDEREQRMARELDLSANTVGYDDTGRIQTPGATDPPRVSDVASDLVRDALKKFPNK